MDNVKGMFAYPFSVCCGNSGELYVSETEKGKAFTVRAAHYPAEV